jgi:Bacterial Ig domain
MIRLKRAAVVAAIVFAAGCTADAGDLTGPSAGPSRDIEDAAHGGAVPGFYFLPPMVQAPAFSGTFDAALQPRVEICELSGATCGTVIAQFTFGTGPGNVRVDAAAQHYAVNWHTNNFNLDPAKHYRISVYSGSFRLGFADVDVVSSGKELKNVDTQEFIPLLDDRTLPIKFRIETGIVGQIVVSPPVDTVNVGGTAQFTATLFDLHGNPVAGPAVVWTSSNPAVATVDASGLATGVSPGTVTITASLGYVSGTATLVVEQPNQPPVAGADVFEAIGNVTVPVAAPGVLANDTDPDADALSAVPGTIATASGGTVTLNADGSFTYLSAPGFTGTDSFEYTVTDGIDTAPGTVTVEAPTRVWYVSNAADAPGDGRDASPFATLKQAESASAEGETIFVLAGDGTTIGYDEGIVLKAGQALTGQGVAADVTASLNGQTVVLLAAGSSPTVARTSPGTTIALASNNTVQGLNVTSVDGAGIAGSGIGAFTAGAIGFVSANGGAAVDLENGTASATFGSLSSNGGAGVRLVNVGGAGVGALSVSASGGANGIVLENTGSLGFFQVTGTGTAGSGGTIQNVSGADGSTAGIGIYLSNARNVSLSSMQLSGFDNFAIRGIGVVGFSMTGTVVSGTSGNNALAGEAAVFFTELTGSASISGSSIAGGVEDNFRLVNSAGVLDRITFSNSTFGANATATGDDGVFIEARNGATVNVTVQNSAFTAARGDLFQLSLLNTSSSDLVFTGNTLTNNHPNIANGAGGVTLGSASGANPTLTYQVSGNTFRDALGTALAVIKGGGAGSFSGTISNNAIGVSGAANSGSAQGSGVDVTAFGGGTHTVAITGNQIHQYSNFGILLTTGNAALGGHGALNATVTGNTIAQPGAGSLPINGVHLNAGTNAGDQHQVCLALGGAGALANSISGSGALGGTDFRLRQRQLTTVRLPGYAGANNDNAAVVAFVQANQAGAPTGAAANTVATGGGGFVGGAACPQP